MGQDGDDDLSAPDFATLWDARMNDDQRYIVYDTLYEVQQWQQEKEEEEGSN
jgi:hypothetical protein